ncbi:MAG: transposase [Thermoplasmataceae archaeon]
MHSFVDDMKDIARMMKVHIDCILNYFTDRTTNAKIEGINSKFALIEKITFAYRNKRHLKTAIHLWCGDLHPYL